MFRITPYKSFDLLDAFRDFERDFFGSEMPVTTCKTDIREVDGMYILEAEMPGFDKEDIKIDVEGGRLSLSAERGNQSEKKEAGYIRRERSYGSFKRSFNIENVEEDKIEAEYKNGVLTLTMPQKGVEAPKSRRLEIN